MNEIIQSFRSDAGYREYISGVKAGGIPCVLSGMCDSARPFFVAAAAEDTGRKALVILPEEKYTNAAADVLSACGRRAVVYPSRDFVFENVSAYSREYENRRLSALYTVLRGNYDVILAVPDALMQYTMPKSVFESNTFTLARGGEADIGDICKRLVSLGYTRSGIVEGVGQFAVRGGIVDVFTPQLDDPVRIDFFGTEIDLIGRFDIVSQRRSENLESVDIIPCRELNASGSALADVGRELDRLIASFHGEEKRRASLAAEREAISNGERGVFTDRFFSLIYPQSENLLKHMPDPAVFVFDSKRVAERARGFELANRGITESLAQAGMCSLKYCRPFCTTEELFASLGSNTTAVDPFSGSGTLVGACAEYEIRANAVARLTEKTDLFIGDIEDYIAEGRQILVSCCGAPAARAMSDLLSDHGIPSYRSAGVLYPSRVAIIAAENDSVRKGFELPGANFVLLTDSSALASERVTAPRRRTKQRGAEKIASYTDLSVGDLVVHVNHGIGRYEGIKNLVSQGISRDFIKIVYADNGILYVPCDQLDMVGRYIGAENTKLSKMGGAEWKRTKARAKAAASEIAKELIKLYAERRKSVGYAFPPDDDMQSEFESGFEYDETDGQSQAAREIKRDMENSYPMDRLLCGDVGFGKTEVSLRAVFKCVFAGKQAAILVPTTILAFQHYRTVLSRFRGYPVNIRMMSRFVSAREMSETVEGIEKGTVDIVIGTHRLLQKNIKFRDLGLLVVDEEQRFGVVHKEKLKELAKGVDVLTLTATPIPRTLNMALSGIRDMSVLEEAPVDRRPVQTFVIEQDDTVIHEAIRRELRRGGQVFYLHNSIDSIFSKAASLKKAFPEANIAVGHGRMEREQLSDVWADMVDGNIDILVCTTIIESGVNVPNANTLIIEDADRMGLSQLHQIRGRVGRSARKAYAYLTYRPGAVMSEIAEKRLEAIREFTEFGSGFKIALRDLELRGAGSLLGSEQSGHLEAIGYDLYIKILEDAINAEKGIEPKAELNCTVDIKADAYIPEDYITLPDIRIDIYKKIASVSDENEEDDLYDELSDRFGDIPEPTSNLIRISKLRNTAITLGITSIEQTGASVSFYIPALDAALCSKIAYEPEFRGSIMISAGGRPHINYRLREKESGLSGAEKVIERYKKMSEIEYGQKQSNDV